MNEFILHYVHGHSKTDHSTLYKNTFRYITMHFDVYNMQVKTG